MLVKKIALTQKKFLYGQGVILLLSMIDQNQNWFIILGSL